MPYKTGDILHCTGSGLISRLIMFFTRSRVSHSAMFVEVWGQPYVIDAQKDGVNIRPFEDWRKKYKYKYIVHRSQNEFISEKAIATKALSKCGMTAYDFNGLLIRQPWSILTGKYKKKPNEEYKMYCSEFVSWVYGINSSYRISPGDLFYLCVELEFKVITPNE